MTARVLFRRTHLVLSLVAGLWLAACGIAGSLLVFGDAVDPVLHSDLYRAGSAPHASLDAVIEAAQRAAGGTATRVRLAGDATPVHEVWIDCDDCTRVWVDPSNAAVNGVRSAHGTTRLFLHELHRRMLVRGAGDYGALAGGAVLVVLAITGLLLGWRGGLRLRRMSNYELHRVSGLALSPLLLVAGITGIYFIQAGLRAPAAPAAVRMATRIDPLVAAAARQFPGVPMTWVSLAGPNVTVRFRQSAEKHPNGRTFVTLDARTGSVVAVTDALAASRTTWFFDNLYPLHIGATGGVAHKALLVLAGFSPAFFMVTGVILYLRRARTKKKQRAARWSAAALPVPVAQRDRMA